MIFSDAIITRPNSAVLHLRGAASTGPGLVRERGPMGPVRVDRHTDARLWGTVCNMRVRTSTYEESTRVYTRAK